jgi:hypothetical protein
MFWGLWWVMVAIGLAIATVLLLRGSYLLGLLIAALAIVRVVYVSGIARRGRSSRDLHGAGPVREVLHGLARHEFVVAAGTISLGPVEARRAFDQGRSLAELAAGAGVPVEHVVDVVVSDASAKLDREVAEGRMTQDQVRQVKARLPTWANGLVHFHKGDVQRARGWA